MDNEKYITLRQFCAFYEVETSFIRGLADHGLVRIVVESGDECVDREELADIERMIRMHYDLEINVAGIEAIHHLLQRVREMQRELLRLRAGTGE